MLPSNHSTGQDERKKSAIKEEISQRRDASDQQKCKMHKVVQTTNGDRHHRVVI